jgi:hypothetical protein
MKKSTTEKRLSVEEEIKRLEQQRKQLRQQERAEAEQEKKQRQLLRGGLLEKLLPHLATLTDEQFENFVKKSLLPPEPKPTPPIIPQAANTAQEVVADEE